MAKEILELIRAGIELVVDLVEAEPDPKKRIHRIRNLRQQIQMERAEHDEALKKKYGA